MSTAHHLPIFMLASLLVLAAILTFVLRSRSSAQPRIWLVSLLIGPGGMVVAKYLVSVNAPWWLYYTVPMVLTLALPVIAFRMRLRQAAVYWALAFLSAPLIHVIFAITLGWREYMPFLPVP